ncbi:MAG: hypothetical protein JW772_02225 [Candidatus Diapherotrites archaeon]|nr:hypothetical protein [Candidatus Diapherotrites archaeon]
MVGEIEPISLIAIGFISGLVTFLLIKLGYAQEARVWLTIGSWDAFVVFGLPLLFTYPFTSERLVAFLPNFIVSAVSFVVGTLFSDIGENLAKAIGTSISRLF